MTRKGFKLIVLKEETYKRLKEMKGKLSFDSFINKLLKEQPSVNTEPKEVLIQEPEAKQRINTQRINTQQAAFKQPEFRYYGCRDCTLTSEQAKLCRIREMKYAIYGWKCPRE